MANPIDAYYQQLVDASEGIDRRTQNYRQTYNENHAYRLANAYMQYPWINPQILVSLVLSDGDEVLPQVADLAARRMVEKTGLTPYDLARKENIARLRQQAHLKALEEEDPTGAEALSLYAQSWTE